jgi:hypothetical protein
MQRTASLLGLSLATIVAGWTIQALRPTPTDIAARHYGLILIDNPASDFKKKSRHDSSAKVEDNGRLQSASIVTAVSDGICIGSARCKTVDLAAE